MPIIPDMVVLTNVVPHLSDLFGIGSAFIAAAIMALLGRLVARGRGGLELNFLAGWGVTCLVLTFWGMVTAVSMVVPATALLAAAAIGLILPATRPSRADLQPIGRILLLAAPILLVMASLRISMPDTYLNLLPNAAYLFDQGMFPADSRPPSFSLLPGAPYNTQLAVFLGGWMMREFPASGLAFFNILLQIAFAVLLARILIGDERKENAPGWSALALALILVTAANPGFTPRISFASYGEPGLAVMVGAAGWLAVRLLERLAAKRSATEELFALALILAGLVNIKQQSPALVAAIGATTLALAALDRRIAFPAVLRSVALAVAPAFFLFVTWKLYVRAHFAVGELELMPIAHWPIDKLPEILSRIGLEITHKPYFFGGVLAVGWVFFRRLRYAAIDQTTRLLGMMTGVFLLYNLSLLFTYVAHFGQEHSYFRYNIHLSLLLVIGLALIARELWRERHALLEPRVRRALPGTAVAVMLLLPLIFVNRLRYDLQMPQPVFWDYAKAVSHRVNAGDKVALLLPGDNGSVADMFQAIIRWTAPRRSVEFATETQVNEPALIRLAAAGFQRAVLTCVPATFAGLPPGGAVFLEYRNAQWHAEILESSSWRPDDRWAQNLSSAPLCRENGLSTQVAASDFRHDE